MYALKNLDFSCLIALNNTQKLILQVHSELVLILTHPLDFRQGNSLSDTLTRTSIDNLSQDYLLGHDQKHSHFLNCLILFFIPMGIPPTIAMQMYAFFRHLSGNCNRI